MRQPIKSGRDNERSMAGQQQGVRQQPLGGEGRQKVAGNAASDPTKPVFNKKALRIPKGGGSGQSRNEIKCILP